MGRAMTKLLLTLSALFTAATLATALALFAGWPVGILSGAVAFIGVQQIAAAFARRKDKRAVAREFAQHLDLASLGGDIDQAQILFNITNDAWFDGSIGPAQHADHARIRAVEEGLPLIRAANSGLTFVTDPLGRITARLAPQQQALLDIVPDQRLAGTLFARWRYWPLLIAGLLGLAVSIVAARRSRRRQG